MRRLIKKSKSNRSKEKSLTKKAFGVELYHATSIESFKSILDQGMLYPQENNMSDFSNKENIDHYFGGNEEIYETQLKNFEGYTFFATDEYSASFYGNRAVANSSTSGLYAVLNFDLSPDALLPDLNDCPTCSTWQESKEQVGQVCVAGPVSTDYLKSIKLASPTLFEEIYTTVDNWERDLVLTLSKSVKNKPRIEYLYREIIDSLGIDENLYL